MGSQSRKRTSTRGEDGVTIPGPEDRRRLALAAGFERTLGVQPFERDLE